MCPYINTSGRLCGKDESVWCPFFGCEGRLQPGSEHCGLIDFEDKRVKLPKLPKKPQSYEYNYYI